MAHSACSVAIALDDVNGDAVPGQLFGVHIATRAGAEENDVPEASAFGGDQRWQRSVIDYRNLGVAEQGRELVRGHIAIAIDGDRRVPVAPQFFGDTGEGIVGVGKNSAQCHLPVLVRSLQCRHAIEPRLRCLQLGSERQQGRLLTIAAREMHADRQAIRRPMQWHAHRWRARRIVQWRHRQIFRHPLGKGLNIAVLVEIAQKPSISAIFGCQFPAYQTRAHARASGRFSARGPKAPTPPAGHAG